jgi:hypothetical protein
MQIYLDIFFILYECDNSVYFMFNKRNYKYISEVILINFDLIRELI